MDQSSSGGQKGRPNRNRRRSQGGQNRGSGSSNQPKSRQNQSSGNRNRNNRRSNGGGRRSGGQKPPVKQPSLGSRILSVLTFGLMGEKSGGPKKNPPRKTPVQPLAAAAPPKKRVQKNSVVEVTGNRLYIENLDFAATESDLNELFRGVGTVVSAEVATNSTTQQSKGFAFVEMSHIDEARRAFDILHDEDFMGRRLSISTATDSSGEGSSSGSGSAAA
jgi:hypothetical protein